MGFCGHGPLIWELQEDLRRLRRQVKEHETINDKLDRYVAARGLVLKNPRPSGRKVCEEAVELAIEIASGNVQAARLELADVVFAAARQASLLGTTLEECIEEKIIHDTGRET